MTPSAPERNPLEQLLDVFVHAPIGLLLGGPGEHDALVEKGRTLVGNACAIGEYTVRSGRSQVGACAGLIEGPVGELLRSLGLVRSEDATPTGATPGPGGRDTATATRASTGAGASEAGGAPDAGGGRTADDLAIADYDSLPASQVVPRLRGLPPEALREIRDHERAGRNRKTVLARIDQLLG